jgi:hypothetical protein
MAENVVIVRVSTPTRVAAVYLLILGLGLGLTMQVLVLAAQNAVDYRLLGVATSASTLSRSIGGSIGVPSSARSSRTGSVASSLYASRPAPARVRKRASSSGAGSTDLAVVVPLSPACISRTSNSARAASIASAGSKLLPGLRSSKTCP